MLASIHSCLSWGGQCVTRRKKPHLPQKTPALFPISSQVARKVHRMCVALILIQVFKLCL